MLSVFTARTGQFATINGLALGNPIRRRSGHPNLESTDDLQIPWQLLKDNIPGNGNPVTIPDPPAKTIPQRFYRLVVVGL